MIINSTLKKILKIAAKTLIGFVICFVLLYVGAYIYIKANKAKFIRDVTTLIEEKTDGNVKINDMDIAMFQSFPSISVLAKNVEITDTLFHIHKHKFFHAQELFVKVSLLKLITGKKVFNNINVKDGGLYLYTDTSGYTNKYLIQKKNKDSIRNKNKKESNTDIETISLTDFRVTVSDERRRKLQDFTIKKINAGLEYADSLIFINTDVAMLVNDLSFNTGKGSYLQNTKFDSEFNLKINTTQNQLAFDSIIVNLNNHPFNITGRFNFYPTNPDFDLKIHTKNVVFESVKKMLTKKIANAVSIVNLSKPLTATANIQGPLNGGEPFIKVDFALDKTDMTTPFLDFNNASFTGYYTNEVTPGLPRRDPNSKIYVNGFTATWRGLPVNTKQIDILNLENPLLTADISSDFPLAQLNEIINSSTIQLNDGTGSVNLSYKGPLVRNTNTNTFLNGNISFKNGLIDYTPRGVTLKKVNGDMNFSNSNLFIKNLHCDILGNDITMNGQALNLLTLINTAPNNVNIDWHIYSPKLNLQSFIYLLKSPKKVEKRKISPKQLANTADAIDAVMQQSKLNVELNVNSVIYKKFAAENVNANVAILPDKYVIKNVSMQSSAGNISLNGSLANESSQSVKAALAVAMTNVDMKKILSQFNNFGQDAITAQNINGLLNTKLNVSLLMKDDATVIPQTLNGNINFSLKNGSLIQFEPIQKMKNFLIKNRNFDTVRFAELKNNIVIKNGEMHIPRMEIQSNVLTMFVEGLYSTRGNTDMSIQVPLSNLKKRDKNYKPKNKGTDTKTGTSIYLRGRPGKDGSINFKLDLFNKFKKDKNNKDE